MAFDDSKWPVKFWDVHYREEGGALTPILAWVVQPEGEDETAVWSSKCIIAALMAHQDLALLTPVLDGEVGGWLYEEFKRKGCQHCKKGWKRHAVVLRLQHTDDDWWIEDGAGHVLQGLTGLNLRETPIRVPSDYTRLTIEEAQIIREVVRGGLAQPVFK